MTLQPSIKDFLDGLQKEAPRMSFMVHQLLENLPYEGMTAKEALSMVRQLLHKDADQGVLQELLPSFAMMSDDQKTYLASTIDAYFASKTLS